MKADPTVQLRLLDLQQLDTRLSQIAHARARIPQQAELEAAHARLGKVQDAVIMAQTQVSDVERELARAEGDVQLVRDRATRDRSRLESGQGSAKDLQALQHELESLARRQATLEDVELEVMERAEEVRARLDDATAQVPAAEAEVARLTDELAAARADLDAQEREVSAPRASILAEIDDPLLALYDRVRAQSGGLGAAALRARRCGGCQLELNPVELNRMAAAPEDEVLRCEECGRIVVRTDESGLPA
ncbi:C4-type zinc ribbon domain-containing protein [Janibacter melonis]|uniref:zinc ribbon domain-containing protein n=1 Tax=Janibacter melonis TaxID=262209 RepID=UPI001E355743|nr:C4-type zinc ribbon domain-containing protein [Janibacter melonis]MCB5993136.1 C4-type zinc ribbon domain-containing protein [Janibacter melonis]